MLLTRKLAYGGLSTALVLISISISYISPTADLVLFTLSSLFIAMVVIEAGFKTGFMAYVASGILITAFFGIYYSLPFLIVFGLYPLIKGIIESRLLRWAGYVLKTVYFIVVLVAGIFLFNEQSMALLANWNSFLPGDMFSSINSVWIILPVALAGLFLYDYALGLLIGFFNKRIGKFIKK